MDDRDRVKIFIISKAMMLAILQNRLRIADFDLPDDTKIVEVGYDTPMRGFSLVLWSAQFESVPVGRMPPQLPPILWETIE